MSHFTEATEVRGGPATPQAAHAHPPVHRGRATHLVNEHAPSAAVVLALSWWATYFVWGSGGREPGVLSAACALLLVAAVLVRPWTRLSPWVVLVAAVVGLASYAVVLTAPTGLAGAHEAASYTYAANLGVVVLAWATTSGRRVALLTVLLASGGFQFAQGWLPWWGRQDQSELFQGTFYWHNQVGIFLVAGALLSFALVAHNRRPLSLLAWVVGPLCAAGVVFTTSRGSQIGLVLGAGLIGLAALRRRRTWPGAVRLTAVAALSWLTSWVLVGPPFFPDRVSAVASTTARADSFVSNGVQRFEDWRRAFEIFAEWPWTGAGFYSFRSATEIATTKRDGVETAFAHNGFLQAAADGGLVLAVPLLLALAMVVVAAARHLRHAVHSGDLTTVGATVTLLVLLLHSGMDFDWTYPALLSLVPLVAVLAVRPVAAAPSEAASSEAASTTRPRLTGALLAMLPLALLAVSVVAAWHGGLDLNTAVPR